MNWAEDVKVLDLHRSLLADTVRTQSYQRAIAQSVRAGDVVLGSGGAAKSISGVTNEGVYAVSYQNRKEE